MKPGRDLDALIAEKVMGSENNCPHYSTDITAAWEVVEKFHKIDVSHTFDGWFCSIDTSDEYGQNGTWSHAQGQSAPHAICLAALNVVGEEEG